MTLTEVLAEMREHRRALDAADFTGQHIVICKILVKLPEWAAALAKYEPLIEATEAYAAKGDVACPVEADTLCDEALALFATKEKP